MPDARRPAISENIAGLDAGAGAREGAGNRVHHVVRVDQAENELPQPQPPVAFGFLNVKPEPCNDVT